MTYRWKIAQWFELQWWKRYLHAKSKTDYLAWKKAYWQNVLDVIKSEVTLAKGEVAADIGCGPAGIFIALDEQKVVAVDPLIEDYESQLSYFVKKEYPNVEFVSSSIEQFSDERKFRVVFCINAINHVADLGKALQKLSDVCVGGGFLVLSIDAHNHKLLKHLFRLIPGDILHPHQYNLDEYRAMCKASGFDLVKSHNLKTEMIFNHHLLVMKKC